MLLSISISFFSCIHCDLEHTPVRNARDEAVPDPRCVKLLIKDLYAEIKRRWSGSARGIIFITGDISGTSTMRFLKENNLPYVAEPFDQKALTKQVNELLEKIT